MILAGASFVVLPFGSMSNGADFVVSALTHGADVELNGRLAKDLGFLAGRVSGWMTAPSRQWPTLSLPSRPGGVKTATEPREQAVELRISGVVQGDDISTTRARVDALKHVLIGATVRVITPDMLGRYVVADLAAIGAEQFGPQFRQRKLPVEITLIASDPYHYDTTMYEVRAPAGTRARCELGTAPVRPLIHIDGAGTNPVVTLRDYMGNVVATMTLTTSLIATEYLDIDCAAFSIYKNGLISPSTMAILTGGDFLKLNPAALVSADRSQWPTLETSQGSLYVRYERAWL